MLRCIRFYCTKPISTVETLEHTVKPKKITKAKSERFIVSISMRLYVAFLKSLFFLQFSNKSLSSLSIIRKLEQKLVMVAMVLSHS